jgi:spore maturation protein CgeB
MNSLSILYIGRDTGTSAHRIRALQRLGHGVHVINPVEFLKASPLLGAWSWKTGGLFLASSARRRILSDVPPKRFDLVYVDGGELVSPDLIRELRIRYGPVINYNVDDPYGKRDGRRFRLYLKAVPFYDLVVVVRDCNVAEARARGARDVLHVHRSADEVAHAPREIGEKDRQKWAAEVSFVGTWMPERGPFMARLVELGVPLSIYGNRWHKAPEWPVLRSAWRGEGLYADDDYARAIQCARINLGLLSKGNRDTTTQRSFEIPHLGAVFCAERTADHRQLYKEDEEAVFWSTPEECAEKCMELLEDGPRRIRLAANGRYRCLQNKTTNEAVMTQILNRTLGVEEADTGKSLVENASARS